MWCGQKEHNMNILLMYIYDTVFCFGFGDI